MIHSTTKAIIRTGVAAMLVTGLSACAGGLFGGSDEKTTPSLGDRTPILSRIESGAEVDPALASVSVVLPPAQANSEWAQGGGTAGKNQGHVALASQPSQAWTATVAGSSNRRRLGASPVVGGGRLYVVDTAGNVSAFDAQTGAPVWRRDSALANDLQDVAFGGGVSFADGRLYGTNGAGEVLAMDAATGDEL
ncbi:MAG: PQQ-binding-like beta-propeller repeat protein, partial [Alphaproteobacteria bacterium]|nr:PQQ-binding-like beta-propeller repeat protein [Alphaproteobacteria bacterium]